MFGAMGTIKITIPLVTWRDGRPRYFPSPLHRTLGYKSEDLRHPGKGPWFTVEECKAWSEKRVPEIMAAREKLAGGATTKKVKAEISKVRRAGLVTVGYLLEAFTDPNHNPRMGGKAIVVGKKKRKPLAASTARFYRNTALILREFDEGIVWNSPAVELTGRALGGILGRIEEAHGLAQTRSVRSTISAAYAYGRGKGWVTHNPAQDLEETLPTLDEDLRPATVAEIETFIAGADALGFPDLADVICAGPWTGQRQADRLATRESQITDDGIMFEPNKKKRKRERLLIPVATVLAQRLEAARERRRGWKVARINDRHIFICERTKEPWKADWYRKVYRAVRHALAFGEVEKGEDGKPTREAAMILGDIDVKARLAAAGITPLPSLATLKDKHLRDTCLSWLPLAGADKFEIAGFSGHAFGHDDKILRHYVAIPPEFARRGMAKLEAWHAAKLAEIAGKKQAGKR